MQRLFDLYILKRIPTDWARIFQLQSSLASAESHMRERETDYILRIEYERPKVGGGISVAWTCICIFSVTHRFARHVFYSHHSLKRCIHDLKFSFLWKLSKIPTFIYTIVHNNNCNSIYRLFYSIHFDWFLINFKFFHRKIFPRSAIFLFLFYLIFLH